MKRKKEKKRQKTLKKTVIGKVIVTKRGKTKQVMYKVFW